ncbi:MAG TPA: hypothetical protein VGQ39_11870 [Pyrinomonadaceae bacterium]|jgi:hypothetical protein|nr:hypothetical protein [Pyrinomonadaceae bacterium]
MKKMIRLITLGATMAVLSLPIMANSLLTGSELQDQCSEENKQAYYKAFLDNRKTDEPKAYDNAKKYLACPVAADVTEATKNIIAYLKKWAGSYEEGSRKQKLTTLLYTEHKYPEAYALGRELLAAEPENLKVLVDLGANGYLVQTLKNPQLNTEALNAARKAVALLESGKTIEDWQPLAGRDVAIAYLNYTIGVFTVDSDPSAAVKNLIKAAQFETPLKASPFTYSIIAGAYETGAYAKQSEAYKANFSGKDESPESKLALANINQLIDRMIDGYARAVALAGADSKFAAQKPQWTESLTTWYKFRNNNSDKGMTDLIAGILAKPLPPEPTPLTSLPAAPSTTPIGTTGTATNGTTASPTAPTGTQTAAPAGTATKTAGNKTPGGPNKPRKNHQ